ncbi:Ribose-phosphate pyrophosphokinase [Hondaea fermentalgiana]|uniref:ribose-phosphate diphosphokinase n=1 Tax=Hondaea fermentalgiana TaxID=2315210 RepID=A0A2R5GB37_9STRA|nr:Ribose-phosphate pyrophosphokinase [Hondaea fermentalgiana]|eukprot:GBG25341.1 Ribose-phosphate pyrophosphokinase [Hondaea fermentalgiana]
MRRAVFSRRGAAAAASALGAATAVALANSWPASRETGEQDLGARCEAKAETTTPEDEKPRTPQISMRTQSRTKPVSSAKKPHLCSLNNDFTPGCGELKVFAGNSNLALAEEVAQHLGVSVGRSNVKRFADGEVSVKLDESVRGKDVYIVQPTSPPVNENLMELLLMVSAARHASAKRVTVVVPYFGYMRSLAHSAPTKSRTDWNYARSNLAAADVARMMEVAGAQSVIAVDIHPPGQGMAEGFFERTPIETLRAADFVPRELANIIKSLAEESEGLAVVSPHASCLTKAKNFKVALSEALDTPIDLATIIRTPPPPSPDGTPTPRSVDLVGNVKGKSVIIVEDIMESGSTTCAAIDALHSAGAKSVSVYCSHALFNGEAAARLAKAGIEKIVVLNTVPVRESDRAALGDKLEIISVAPEISELIRKMHYETK